MRPLLLPLALLAIAAAPGRAGAQIRDDSTGLVIQPPDYLHYQGEDLLAPPSLIACWYAPPEEDYPWVKVCAERLDELPQGEKLGFQWKGKTLSGSRIETTRGRERVVLFSVLVPLQLGTVRLDAVAPVDGAEQAKAMLEETLATVADRGLWVVRDDELAVQSEQSWSDRSDRRAARLMGKVGMALLIAGIMAWVRDRRAKRKQAEGAAQG